MKGFFRKRERVVRHERSDVRQLRGFRAEKLSARRNIVKEAFHGDGGPARQAGFLDFQQPPAGEFDARPGRLFEAARLDR